MIHLGENTCPTDDRIGVIGFALDCDSQRGEEPLQFILVVFRLADRVHIHLHTHKKEERLKFSTQGLENEGKQHTVHNLRTNQSCHLFQKLSERL